MLGALAGLLFCQLAGELTVRAAGLPVPGPVLGAVILLALIRWRGGVPGPLGTAARGLLAHLSLLFVPAGTGVLVHLERVREDWAPILAAVVLGTALTIAVTGWTFAAVLRRAGGEAER